MTIREQSGAELVEYLFLDVPRIQMYLQQVGTTVTYDKVPVWKTSIGLTGPRVEASQDRRSRAATPYEMLSELLRVLEARDQIIEGRPLHPDELTLREGGSSSFRHETMTAQRCRLEVGGSKNTLNLWVSTEPDEPAPGPSHWRQGSLLLIEDLWGEVNPRPLLSGYSSLLALFEELEGFADKTALARLMGDRSSEAAFGTDPIGTLARLGPIVGAERRVTALYRLRAVMNEPAAAGVTVTIGYPLAISEAS